MIWMRSKSPTTCGLSCLWWQDALNYYADQKQYIDVCNELTSINDSQLAVAQYGTRPDSILSRRKPVT